MAGTYNRQIFAAALRELGIGPGALLFSHSNIAFFGYPEEGRSVEVACQTILDAIFDVIGPGGTLVVPTFTYSFPKGEVFDPLGTPSDCGVFTEFVRTRPAACRSTDPCVSVAAIGRRAKELTENAPENSYGPGCFFERFLAADGTICNFNFDAGSTFLHYVERQLAVPYRFDKTFEGTICLGGRDVPARSTIWVRYVSSDETVAVFEPFHDLATSAGLFRTGKVGRGTIGVIAARDCDALLRSTLPRQPWLLTRAGQSGVVPELIPEG